MMKKKNTAIIVLLGILSALFFIGCSKEETKTEEAVVPASQVVESKVTSSTAGYEDGIYFAMDEAFASSGWKETVTITVSGGKITDVDWNGVNIAAGVDKKTYDQAGKYNMVKFGKAQAEWYQQAQKAEAYLIANQDPTSISYTDSEGHTDDIAGVSVHVNSFFDLAAKALASGPVGRGQYADGAYFAIDESFGSSGWKEYVSVTVLNGRIASVSWSGVNKTGDDKKAFDMAGNYNMVKFGKAQAEWYQQAQKAEEFLIAKQDLNAITYSDDQGHTDDIAGVSIHVNSFYALVEKALAAGPVSLGSFADGGYYASEDAFGSSGWKGFVSLFVKNGNLVSVNWSGVNEAGDDKKQFAADGKYGMVKASALGKEWHEQASAVETYLLSTQDPKKISYKDESGHTDDIAGASIHVMDFYSLVEKALASGLKK